MKLKYKNSRGTLTFGGGSQTDFNLTKIEGLGNVEKVVSTATYYGQAGVQTLNAIDGARTITVSGDLLLTSRAQYATMMSILSLAGVLTVELDNDTKRLIDIAYTSVTPSDNHGKWRTYVIQFHADNPYFYGDTETEIVIYGAGTKYIDAAFLFPHEFSEGNNTTISYSGDADCEPEKIYIVAVGTVDVLQGGGKGIEITNTTSGASIRLDYEIKDGEIITIDVAQRTIKNQYGDDLMQYLDPETFIDGFKLVFGTNQLYINSYQTNVDMTVTMVYKNWYCEAVF